MKKHNKIFSLGYERLREETGKEEQDANDVLKYITEHPELMKEVEDITDFTNFIIMQQVKEKVESVKKLLDSLE